MHLNFQFRQFIQLNSIRTTLQTAAAVLLAYVCAVLLNLEDPSWAVFSALFVVQANVGGTIGSALWRISGALIGAIIAVVLVWLLPEAGWHTVVAMLAGVSLMSLVSLRYPELSYGLVTVAIITVAPDFQLVEGALSKVAAIAVGSCSAILACMVVLPVSAHRSAEAKVAEAIRLCGHAVADCLHCTIGTSERKQHESEYHVSKRLRDAWLTWHQSTMEDVPARFTGRRSGRCTRALFSHARRLQEDLALVERIGDRRLSDPVSAQHRECLEALAKEIELRLHDISVALTQRGAKIDTQAIWSLYKRFADEVDRSAAEAEDPQDREQLWAIKWSCSVVLNCVEAINGELEPAR